MLRREKSQWAAACSLSINPCVDVGLCAEWLPGCRLVDGLLCALALLLCCVCPVAVSSGQSRVSVGSNPWQVCTLCLH